MADQKKFDNEERRRYYGLRIGDMVNPKGPTGKSYGIAEVVEYALMDNNRVYLKRDDGSVIDWVAEWCEIITKVDDK